MNGKERIITTLKGAIPDRVPISLFVQEEFLSYMYPDKTIDRVVDAVDCAKHFDFDIMTRSRAFNIPYFMRKSYPNWEIDFRTVREAGNYYEICEIKTPSKNLKQVEAGPDVGGAVSGLHLSTIEYLIKDDSDLEAFIKYVPDIDVQTISDMKEYCSWSKEIIGDFGISAPWGIGGIYNLAATYRNVTDLMMDPYINPGFYNEYMEKLTGLAVKHDSEFASANGEAIGIQGNIANAAVIGKKFFNEYILPYEKKLVSAINSAGSFTIYHNCGNAEVLQESYVGMGLTAWETVAEYPQGDNSLKLAKEKVGGKMTLIGNLDQVNFLKTAAAIEVEKKVKELIEIGKPGGRYIFACSDYLEKGTPFENINAMVEAAKQYGGY